jgi:TPR repeat protein
MIFYELHNKKTEMEYFEIKREIEKYIFDQLEKNVYQGTFFFNSHFQLGMKYEDGSGTEKNLKKAFDFFNKAIGSSMQENPFFLIKLGSMYQHGIGSAKNLGKALELYKKAADQGNSLAQFNLGRIYEKGIGTEKNLEKTIELYQKSADQGNSLSQFRLAKLYKKGIGTAKNLEKAHELYKIAANQGNSLAKKADKTLESKTGTILPIQQIGAKRRRLLENDNDSQQVQSCKTIKHNFELLQQKQIEQGQQIIELKELIQQHCK